MRSSWCVSFLCLYSNHDSACKMLQKCQSTGPSRTLKNVFRGATCAHHRHQDIWVLGAVRSRARKIIGGIGGLHMVVSCNVMVHIGILP